MHTHRCECGNEWSCERDTIPAQDGGIRCRDWQQTICTECFNKIFQKGWDRQTTMGRLQNMTAGRDPLLALRAAERLREIASPDEINPQVLKENPDAPIAYQKFCEAKHSLESVGPLVVRLAKVFGNLNTLREDDFPDEDRLRERFSALMPKLEILAAPREKPLPLDEIIENSIAKDQAEDLAQEIRAIFAALARRYSLPPS